MKSRSVFLCLLALSLMLQPAQADELEHIMKFLKAADIFELNEYPSTPEMRGGVVGTEEYNKAAQWAKAKFKEWGLAPVYDDFLQPFELSYNETHDSAFSLIFPSIGMEGKPETPKRSIVFALFGGEELGLLGSRYMAANLPDFPSKPIFMLNHDMNGVRRGLRIAGGKTYPEFYEILTKVNEKYSINDSISESEISQRFGNSDYAPFLENGIPAYSTWVTGGGGYGVHTEEDTIYVITPKIMEDIVRLFFMAGYLFADK